MAAHVTYGLAASPTFPDPIIGAGSLAFTFAYTVLLGWLVVAVVAGAVLDNMGEIRDTRAAVADDLESRCFICGLDRRIFEEADEEGFNNHVRYEHNVRDFLSFMLHLEQTDSFDYSPQEAYVAEKLNSRGDPTSRWHSFFPVRMAMVLRKNARARTAMISSFSDLAQRVDDLQDALTKSQNDLATAVRGLAKSAAGDGKE